MRTHSDNLKLAIVTFVATLTFASSLLAQSSSRSPAAASGFGFPQAPAAEPIGSYAPASATANYGQSYNQPVPSNAQSTAPATAQQTSYQYPDRFRDAGNGLPSSNLGSPNLGPPNELSPVVQPFAGGGNAAYPGQFNQEFPQNYADIDVYVTETQTGSINFGGAYNSDNGLVGQVILNEKNFDITRFPRSFRDIVDGTAWRGAGQNFRLELVPGADVQRYLASFSEPYLFGTNYSFSASGYLFDRRFFDWDENRLGGRVSLGRRLNQDLSINFGLRMERVRIDNPRGGTIDASTSAADAAAINAANGPSLTASLGKSNLFLANAGLIRDTRDHPYLTTEGSYFSATVSQAFGDYSFTRGDIDWRRYRLMYQRPDGSGRHTISYGTKLGFSGDDTPIFENYVAGGFSTMRGFDFRGVGPTEGTVSPNGIRVGGRFQWLNTVEYKFPLTADDMVKGVLFTDFGTVEQDIDINADNFRVAPGFGLRISVPGLGLGAPLAFDFAFPVSSAPGDEERVFSFYLGALR